MLHVQQTKRFSLVYNFWRCVNYSRPNELILYAWETNEYITDSCCGSAYVYLANPGTCDCRWAYNHQQPPGQSHSHTSPLVSAQCETVTS